MNFKFPSNLIHIMPSTTNVERNVWYTMRCFLVNTPICEISFSLYPWETCQHWQHQGSKQKVCQEALIPHSLALRHHQTVHKYSASIKVFTYSNEFKYIWMLEHAAQQQKESQIGKHPRYETTYPCDHHNVKELGVWLITIHEISLNPSDQVQRNENPLLLLLNLSASKP